MKADLPLSDRMTLANMVSHPAKLLPAIVASYPGKRDEQQFLKFQIKASECIPGQYEWDNSYKDHELMTFGADALGHEQMKDFFDNAARKGWDVILLSKVTDRLGNRYHIPMIDFACSHKSKLLKKLNDRCVLNNVGLLELQTFEFFDSGRSFHGYGPTLMTEYQWLQFLGSLLLLNQVDLPPVVDGRWIGHSLKRGFSGLRWTRNSPKYLKVPEGIDYCPF